MTWQAFFQMLQPLDDAVYAALVSRLSTAALEGWLIVTELGSFAVLVVVAWLMGSWIILFRKRALLAMWLFIGNLGGAGTVYLLKYGSARPRPLPYIPDAYFSGMSFPSGHTAGAWILALLLWTIWNETIATGWIRHSLQWGGILLALLISVSRIALGVHWTSDVYGGILMAIAWVWIWKILFARTRLFSLAASDLPHRYWK